MLSIGKMRVFKCRSLNSWRHLLVLQTECQPRREDLALKFHELYAFCLGRCVQLNILPSVLQLVLRGGRAGLDSGCSRNLSADWITNYLWAENITQVYWEWKWSKCWDHGVIRENETLGWGCIKNYCVIKTKWSSLRRQEDCVTRLTFTSERTKSPQRPCIIATETQPCPVTNEGSLGGRSQI